MFDHLLGVVAGSVPSPLLGFAAGGETTALILGLFILLLGAKVGEELARRLHQPPVVGELIGGFVVGPHALGLVTPEATAITLSEIGVVILLFAVGLEVRTGDLLKVGRAALGTAVIGAVAPFLVGLGVGLAVGEPAGPAAFIGLALAATSIGITSRVLAELGVLSRPFAQVVIGAAVIDDVIALIAIGLVSGAVEGSVSAATLLVAVSAVGLVGLGFAAARRARGLPREAFTWPLFAETPLVPAFLMMLALALFAQAIGLAAIIGAFVAGLIVAETEAAEELEHEIRPLAAIFTPFFFAVTGAQLDLRELADPSILVLALVLAVVATITKTAAGWIAARSLGRWGSIAVGVGMVPRGEVGIVVANLGLGLGLLSPAIFGAVLVAVVLTTMIAPYLLAYAIPRAAAETPAG